MPEALAQRVAALEELYSALDLVEVAAEVAATRRRWRGCISPSAASSTCTGSAARSPALPADTRWQSLARGALRSDLSTLARALASEAIRLAPAGGELDGRARRLAKPRSSRRLSATSICSPRSAVRSIDLAMVSVLLRELRGMA